MKQKLLFLVVITIVSLGFKCGSNDGDQWGDISDGTYRGSIRHRGNNAVSPNGMRIEGYNAIDPAYIPEYDAGAGELFATVITGPYGYTQMVRHSDYKVYIFPRSRHCLNAGFAIPGGWNPWDQTEWDKDPRPDKTLICAAGLNFGFDTMVVADDLGIARLIARYELEHFVLYYNDRDWYNRTIGVHAHPIFGAAAAAYKPPFGQFVAYQLPQAFAGFAKGTQVFVWMVPVKR